MEEFKEIDTFIHSYYIKGLHNGLLEYKEKLIKKFIGFNKEKIIDYKANDHRNVQFKVATSPLIEIDLKNRLKNIFTQLLNKYFHLGNDWKLCDFNTYVQDNNRYVSDYHHHYFDTSIVGVTYIDPPSKGEGGEIEFFIPPTTTSIPFKIQPQKDHIYLFPAWVLHKPLPQISPIPRVSINWGVNTPYKPIHKVTNIRW